MAVAERKVAGNVYYPNYENELDNLTKFMKSRNITFKKKVVREFVDYSFNAKKRLKDILGLDDDYRLKLEIMDESVLNEEKLFTTLYSYIQYYTDIEVDQEDLQTCVISGKIIDEGREYKLVKWLKKIFNQEEMQKFVFENMGSEWNLEKYYSELLGLGKNCSRQIVITCNPLDFVISTEHAGFHSCYTFDGCHANGNVAYARDQFTFMMFLPKKDVTEYPFYKIGRIWGYLPDDAKTLVIGKGAYGNNPKPFLKVVANSIAEKVAKHFGFENSWEQIEGKNYPENLIENAGHRSGNGEHNHESYPVYFDVDVSNILVQKARFKPDKDLHQFLPVMRFNNTVCLNCGVTSTTNNYFICKNCKPIGRCKVCNENITSTDDYIEHGGRYYCRHCFEERYVICSACGQMHDKSYSSEIDGRAYCNDCKRRYFGTCKKCGETKRKQLLTMVDGTYFCETCAQDQSNRCSSCGDCVDNDQLTEFNGERYCHSCLPYKTFICDGCGNRHDMSQQHIVDGKWYCNDCAN